MTATLGEDWIKYFEIVCSYARKPIFFWDQKVMPPFYTLDTSIPNYKGTPIVDPNKLESGKIYLEGNAKLLENFFKAKLGI